MSIFHNILNWLDDATYVWRQELKHVFRDEGVLMFCIVVPLGYPLLYSWIYNNETVTGVAPVHPYVRCVGRCKGGLLCR